MKILTYKEQILQAMTKEELIWWIREKAWINLRDLRWSEILFRRWDIQATNNLAEQDLLNREFTDLNLGRLDEIAAEMRVCTSLNRMKTLIRQANSIRAKYKNHQSRYDANMAEYKRIEKLFKLSKEARAVEDACP